MIKTNFCIHTDHRRHTMKALHTDAFQMVRIIRWWGKMADRRPSRFEGTGRGGKAGSSKRATLQHRPGTETGRQAAGLCSRCATRGNQRAHS